MFTQECQPVGFILLLRANLVVFVICHESGQKGCYSESRKKIEMAKQWKYATLMSIES